MIEDFFKDMIKYIPAQVIPAIVGIVALPIVTRLFPPADYGSYVLVIATVSVLSTIAGWAGMSVVRFYPAYEKDGKATEFAELVVKLTLLSIGATSIVFLCVLLSLRNRVSENIYHLMGIGIFVFILTSLFTVLLDFLRIKRQIKWYSGFSVWKSITALVFGVLFVIFFRFGVEGLLWGAILSIGLILPFLWKSVVGKLQIKNKGISLQSTAEIAKYSFPLVVGYLVTWILSLSDRYVLQFFRSAREVGIYSISYNISQGSIMLLATLFALSFNPLSIIIWEKEGRKASQKFLTEGTRYFLLLCIPTVVGISILQRPILEVLSTPNYYEGAKIIPLIVLGIFFWGLTQKFWIGLNYFKKTSLYMFCIVTSGVVNLGLNFLLIPKYGYVAAAFTTLVSYAFLLFLVIIVSCRYFVWKFPFKSLAKATFASAVMGIVIYFVGNSLTSSVLANLILGTIIGIIAYSLMLLLLREFRPGEVQKLLSLKIKE
jgi:O-antigen/teichoic acid export membrane protein